MSPLGDDGRAPPAAPFGRVDAAFEEEDPPSGAMEIGALNSSDEASELRKFDREVKSSPFSK